MKDIEIEVYGKGKNVVLVLTGLGGTVKGYHNKYEIIANNIVTEHNCTVFVATTPHGSWEHSKENLDYIMKFIDQRMSPINKDYKIYVMGHSAGGTFILWYAYNYPRITRILAANPVLNVNFHKLENGANNFKCEFIKIIIGDKDPSYKYADLLQRVKSIETIILPHIDHEFKDSIESFIDLPNKYLL